MSSTKPGLKLAMQAAAAIMVFMLPGGLVALALYQAYRAYKKRRA